jgi:hypothetical protein
VIARHAPALAVALLAVLFAAACAAFAWQPGLASFADDSVSYLVMGQVFSPWQAAPPPVAEAFVREAFYPPLFPALLGLAGAAHHIAWAHLLTALLLALWLPLAYALGARWLESRWAAAAATLALASLPSLWINVKGVLSEPLFGLLLLGVLVAHERIESPARRKWTVAGLLAALALTRTVGVVVVAGYGLWALTRRSQGLAERARAVLPAVAACAAYGLWMLVRPAGTSDDYLRIVAERAQAALQGDSYLLGPALSALRQARSMAEAWTGSLMLFWVEGSPARVVLAGLAGALALAGLALRFAAGKADAWMTAAYLAVFLAWPFYDQMTRFLFPLLPLLVLYAFCACAFLGRRLRRPDLAHAALALLLLSLTVPALAFIRARSAAPEPYTAITDWYRTPGLEQARARSQVHLALAADMAAIGALTGPGDRVMWVAPSYVALLAGRHGVPAPAAELDADAYRSAVLAAKVDYLFLSEFHPRDTVSDTAWRAGVSAMAAQGKVVHLRSAEGGRVTSMLLRVQR